MQIFRDVFFFVEEDDLEVIKHSKSKNPSNWVV